MRERTMASTEATVKRVHAAFEREPRIAMHRHPIRIGFESGAVVLEGEVESLAAKKLALGLAAAAPEVRGVVDRLRVAPSERRGDGAIRDSLAAFLLRQPELARCALAARTNGRIETLRDAGAGADGAIELAVANGVVTLEGTVPSLTHKRVAGVLAWWTPGCRDVINALGVTPAEDDNDAEIVDALRLVLEMDPLVDAAQVTASCRDCVVTLDGAVRTEEERRQAEHDAWALFAVDRVVNRIAVPR